VKKGRVKTPKTNKLVKGVFHSCPIKTQKFGKQSRGKTHGNIVLTILKSIKQNIESLVKSGMLNIQKNVKKLQENGKRKNPEKVQEQKKRWFSRHRKEVLKKLHEYDREQRRKVKEVFGQACCLCKEIPKKIKLHEKSGNTHSSGRGYILKHAEDFVPLCFPCHQMVHGLMRFGFRWEDIYLLLVGE
jgi:predicted HNH restriction endonuclease